MAKVTQMCCISLTLSAKLIGTFGLSLSILMINMLMSNFFSTEEEEEFIIALKSWMLFGLNWTYVMKSMKITETARILLTCVLIYSALSLIANALLALGSLLKKPSYALPWMYMQMISIVDQTISLAMHLTENERYDLKDKNVWYVPACSIYLLISSYFWILVMAARCQWLAESENYDQFSTTYSSSSQYSNDANMPKTPSYLMSNPIVFGYDSPPPLPPPKYEVV
ncbi:uncharacterized protein LOC131669276 [Phymastichus coffea]|uniref:uncharacterized protein LOC131669276 n=1 Tax=Phymastichus coffea TaxID=108790 RepID=UPI00273C8234|nr:uncharacterized protein LOC131669276 [Phymastichus coffea]